jgi:hypothetical protein
LRCQATSELYAAWTSNEAFKQSREALNSRDVLSSATQNSTFVRTRAGTRQRRQSGEERRQTTIQQYSGKLNLPKACVCALSPVSTAADGRVAIFALIDGATLPTQRTLTSLARNANSQGS